MNSNSSGSKWLRCSRWTVVEQVRDVHGYELKDGEEIKVRMKVVFAVDGSRDRLGGISCNKRQTGWKTRRKNRQERA